MSWVVAGGQTRHLVPMPVSPTYRPDPKLADLGPEFADPVQAADFPQTLLRFRNDRAAATVGLDTLTQANQRVIVDFAAKHRLPAMYASMEFAGGLIAYGVNYPDHYRRAASFVDRIFKGAPPAELPIEQPTKFDLILNMKTANALGLAIPTSLLARSDQVIQ